MPDQTYEVVMHDGRKFRVVADHQPTEEEILAQLPKAGGDLMASHDRPASSAPEEQGAWWQPSNADRERFMSERMGGAGDPELKSLPAGAAAAATLLTGGASLPVSTAIAAGAGGLASIAKNAAEYFHGHGKGSVGEAATDVAKDAALQGGAQLVGGAIGKGAGALGRGMYMMALGAPKALRAEFPGLVQSGIDAGVIPTTESGVTKATAARAASSKAAENIVAGSPAAQAGVRIPATTVTRGLDPLRAEVAARPQANLAQNAIDEFETNMVASHPKGFSLQDLVKTKSAAQDEAAAAYKAAEKAGSAGMDAEANEAIAKRARGIIEHFAPEVEGQNAQTQALVGLTRAMRDASLRQHVMRGALSTGLGVEEGVRSRDPMRGLETAAGVYLAQNPRVLGATGMTLARSAPGAQVVAPQALRAAILSLMGTDSNQAQP